MRKKVGHGGFLPRLANTGKQRLDQSGPEELHRFEHFLRGLYVKRSRFAIDRSEEHTSELQSQR